MNMESPNSGQINIAFSQLKEKTVNGSSQILLLIRWIQNVYVTHKKIVKSIDIGCFVLKKLYFFCYRFLYKPLLNMSSNISIELDNPSQSYIPGSTLNGKLIVFLSKPKKVRSITLYASGEEKTSFYFQSVLQCASEKIFFEYCFILWKPSNGENEVMPAGKQIFKFSFKIPKECLPNFEGEYGNIRYSMKAKMDIAFQLNLKCDHKFYIRSVLPSSIVHNIQKTKGQIFMPKDRFVIGETVNFTANIENQSKFCIQFTETGIKTEIIYKGKTTDSWRGKYFEASEVVNFNSQTRKNKLYISKDQKYCFKSNIELYKLYPSISGNSINVKHWIFVKLCIKSPPFDAVEFIAPIKIYTHKNIGSRSCNKYPTSSISPVLNNNIFILSAASPLLSEAPPAYSKNDHPRLSNNFAQNIFPPKYE